MLLDFVSLGVFVHLVLIYSIFDIYYTSPLVKGTTPHPIHGAAPASRLVLFSADGLRSRTFNEHEEKAPFLRGIIRNGKGSWGASYSHVPTESRPGHVAMAAGFYEDVSAVALGWKHNPVPFDSIFNRSRETWSWGSPDILPMFAENNPHIHTFTYSSEEEDFARKDASALDTWVFDHVKGEFFESAKTDENLDKRLRANKTVFFLHLLGLDSNGHGHKPHSEEYIDNVRVVDQGIQSIVQLFDEFFGDNRTAFVFTADHGMTDWGSHGSGTDDEIITPLVAWGAGVVESSANRTINQVDLAPLMAALLGCAVPLNSVGVLPLEILDAPTKYRFQAARANLRQMREQYFVKRDERLQRSLPFLFKDYPELNFAVMDMIDARLKEIEQKRQYDNAAKKCLQWIPRIRDALLYFHRYQRGSLGFAVAMTFLSWIFLIYSVVSRSSSLPPLTRSIFRPKTSFCVLLTVTSMLLFAQRLPISNFIYILLPIWLLSTSFNIYSSLLTLPDPSELIQKMVETWEMRFAAPWVSKLPDWFARVAATVIVLTIFVVSFTNRSFLSLMTLLMAAYPKIIKTDLDQCWNRTWYACCVFLSIFPQLDTVGNSPSPFLCFFAPVLVTAGLLSVARLTDNWKMAKLLTVLHTVSAIFIGITEVTGSTPWFVSLYAWMSLPATFIIPTFSSGGIVERLAVWITALLLPYFLLSLAYESLFLIVFACLLGIFVRLEMSHLSDNDYLRLSFVPDAMRKRSDSSMDDIHGSFSRREWYRATMLVAFILLGFFGTGNIASLNSFNPSFLRMFLTVFSPFTMAALLIVKIAIPFVLVAFSYTAVLHQDRRGVPRLSILVLIITNTMAMVFFFLLKDDGSWLDIGMSISNYLISMFASLFVFLLLHGANNLFPIEFADLSNLFHKQVDGTAAAV